MHFFIFLTRFKISLTCTGSSEIRFGFSRLRQRLVFHQSQYPDWDLINHSPNVETETGTRILSVSKRPNLNLQTLTETQYYGLKLGTEAETETKHSVPSKHHFGTLKSHVPATFNENYLRQCKMLRLRQIIQRCWDQDSSILIISKDVETETLWDWEIVGTKTCPD